MSKKLILVTGGARSGKSTQAEKLARAAGTKRFYIATSPVCDNEMAARIARHQELRKRDNWATIEEQTDLAGVLQRVAIGGGEVALVDCLTLWINNLLYYDASWEEKRFATYLNDELLPVLLTLDLTVVMVINEVGCGLVPESSLARRFRDMSGRCAQIIGQAADEVYWVVAGIPVKIK